MRSTISTAKVLTVRSDSEMWRVISAPSVPLSRANFSASSPPWFFTSSSNALICKERVSCAVSVWLTTFATSEFTVTSSASEALSPEVRMRVASRLPASSILLTRSPLRSSSSSKRESLEFFRESWTCSVRSEIPSTMPSEPPLSYPGAEGQVSRSKGRIRCDRPARQARRYRLRHRRQQGQLYLLAVDLGSSWPGGRVRAAAGIAARSHRRLQGHPTPKRQGPSQSVLFSFPRSGC